MYINTRFKYVLSTTLWDLKVFGSNPIMCFYLFFVCFVFLSLGQIHYNWIKHGIHPKWTKI